MDNTLSSLYTTSNDAYRYYLESILELFLIFLFFLLYVIDMIPFWLLFIVLVIAYPRYVIMLHELFHIRSADSLSFFYRLLPIPLTPFNVGYREYVQIHQAHHKGPASKHDRDAFQIRGNRFKSFFGALFSPEIHFYQWLKNDTLTPDFMFETIARIIIFVALAFVGGIKFLWFWLSLKLIYGVSSFIFFNLVHYRNGEYGTFETELPQFLVNITKLIWGQTLVYAVMYHNIHHDNVRISACQLKDAKNLL